MANTFVVKKRIPLDDLGEGWEEAFITFTPFTYRNNDKIISLRSTVLDKNATDEQTKKASDDIKELLSDNLIEGKGFNGKELVDITKENLPDLPMEVFTKCLMALQGQTQLLPKV